MYVCVCIDTFSSFNFFIKHYVEYKKWKRMLFFWSHLYDILERAKLIFNNRKENISCLGLETKGRNWLQRVTRVVSGVTEIFYIFIVMVSTQMYILVKIFILYPQHGCILLYMNYTLLTLIKIHIKQKTTEFDKTCRISVQWSIL